MIRQIDPGLYRVTSILLLLLSQGATAFAHSVIDKAPPKQEFHDTNHPLVLARESDFLAALLALHKEALSISITTASQAKQGKIREYAKRAIARHRGQIARLNTLLTQHAHDAKPDFHVMPAESELRQSSGTAADKQYLRLMIRLISEKIELAEFASGTVKAKPVRQLAEATIDKDFSELLMLGRWLNHSSSK